MSATRPKRRSRVATARVNPPPAEPTLPNAPTHDLSSSHTRRVRHEIWSLHCLIRSLVSQALVALRWLFRRPGRHHQLPAQLIVALTSYAPRFETLSWTLRSLLLQTVKPDHLILWIAHSDLPALPKNAIDLQAAGLEIRATDNIGPYTKIIPTIDAFPNAFICTADDDVYYWPSWLEELIEAGNGVSRAITCHRAHEITLNSDGTFRPYNEWIRDTRRRGEMNFLFPTGHGGILYPPGILAHTAMDRDVISHLCPDADDIWLYWIGRRNGARYTTVPRWRTFTVWHGSQSRSLWSRNSRGGNDEQIRKMAQHYGYP